MNTNRQQLWQTFVAVAVVAMTTNGQGQELVYRVVPYDDFEVTPGDNGRNWAINGGTITTDGTLGKVSAAANFLDWEINVTASARVVTYTPFNSSIDGNVIASESGLTVLEPDDSLRMHSIGSIYITPDISVTWGPVGWDIRMFRLGPTPVDNGPWGISKLEGAPNNVAVIVPEPSTLVLLPIGVALLLFSNRSHRIASPRSR